MLCTLCTWPCVCVPHMHNSVDHTVTWMAFHCKAYAFEPCLRTGAPGASGYDMDWCLSAAHVSWYLPKSTNQDPLSFYSIIQYSPWYKKARASRQTGAGPPAERAEARQGLGGRSRSDAPPSGSRAPGRLRRADPRGEPGRD